MIDIAIQAAKKAGEIITEATQHLNTIKVSQKAQNDLVTEIDRLAEQEIINIIHEHYPEHGILAEESGAEQGDDYLWIIDPLDGTINFIHGLPHFAVSIGIQYKNKLQHAVVYDPVHKELFTASLNKGAQLNGQPIAVSKNQQLKGAILATGFPFRELQHLEFYLRTFATFLPYTSGIRRYGSAALDLAYVAAGRLDGFWEFGLYPWDMAAGILLIKEAGGLVSNFQGQENYLTQEHIVAGNPQVYPAMLEVIQKQQA